MPDIPGITDFDGQGHPHHRVGRRLPTPTGERIAIIGTGATAVQLIPELAKKAADLTVYQRTPIWVVPKIDIHFSERAKRLFARVPLTQRAIRWLTDTIYEVMVTTVGAARPQAAPAQRRRGRSGQDAPVRLDPRQGRCGTS